MEHHPSRTLRPTAFSCCLITVRITCTHRKKTPCCFMFGICWYSVTVEYEVEDVYKSNKSHVSIYIYICKIKIVIQISIVCRYRNLLWISRFCESRTCIEHSIFPRNWQAQDSSINKTLLLLDQILWQGAIHLWLLWTSSSSFRRATKDNPPTFQCTGWLIGILLRVHDNPYITG